MPADEPITQWIVQLQNGDATAAQRLWEIYFQRLVSLARAKLAVTPRRIADEEDVALSAFNSFFQGVEKGRFPQLADRNNLWRLQLVYPFRYYHSCHLSEGKNLSDFSGFP